MKQDNPQQATAYIAGYIDGEGTIRIQNQRRRASQFIPQVTITSVVLDPLEFVQRYFGGWIREYQPQSKGNNARRAYQWTLQGRDAVLHLMKAIQPFVIVRKAHVDLMIEFVEGGEVTAPPKPVSRQEIDRRLRIFQQFKQLNMRGVQLQRLSEEAPVTSGDATVRPAGTAQPAEVSRND